MNKSLPRRATSPVYSYRPSPGPGRRPSPRNVLANFASARGGGSIDVETTEPWSPSVSPVPRPGSCDSVCGGAGDRPHWRGRIAYAPWTPWYVTCYKTCCWQSWCVGPEDTPPSTSTTPGRFSFDTAMRLEWGVGVTADGDAFVGKRDRGTGAMRPEPGPMR